MSSKPRRSTVYPFLRFAANVDWQHVDPVLLQKLNAMGAQQRMVIDVISGYRTPQHSVSVGGFADDPHTRGVAVDAEVNGDPIGKVFSAQVFKDAGLESGNQPNFYKGKPDPGHVQLPSSATASTSTSSSAATTATTTPQDQPVPGTGAAAPAADTSAPTAPVGPYIGAQPPSSLPMPSSAVSLPGSVTILPSGVVGLWQQIASQDNMVSPEAQQLFENAAVASSIQGPQT